MSLLTNKRNPLILLGVAFGLVLCSCSGESSDSPTDQLESFVAKDEISIGVSGAAPSSFLDTDGSAAGVEPEVAVAVLELMGIPEEKITARQVSFSALIPGLEAGQFDLLAGAQFMNQTRCAALLFSEPTIVMGYAFIYPEGFEPVPQGLADIVSNNLSVGLLAGTVEERASLAAGVPESNILAVPDEQSMVDALRADRVDVLLGVDAQLALNVGDDASIVIGPRIPDIPGAGSGVIFKKGDEQIRDEFNLKLKELQESGEFQRISNSYGIDPTPAMETTAEELCKNEG